MKRILYTTLFLFTLSLFAQNTEGKEDKELFIDAEYHYLFEEFDKALVYYFKVYEHDSTNANLNYRIGQCILHLTSEERYKRYDAIPYLEVATESMTDNYNEGSYKERSAPYEALYYLGNAYRFKHEFENAIVIYERFLSYLPPKEYYYISFVKRESESCHNAMELIAIPVKYETIGLNDLVNTDSKVENCPVVNFNEDVIVFTSGGSNSFSPDINMAAINADYVMDDIFFTQQIDSVWTQPISINQNLKAGRVTVPTAITGDGKELYIVRDDNDDGNIYVSYFKEGVWSKMKALNRNINTSEWESHASITRDGKTLFFTSDRKGGYGGLDIYKSNFDEEKKDWGPAINLGPTINTMYDEETPNVINDGKTIYFSSQGHYGMGGFDIFYSTLIDSANWTSPMNLGYPLNTVGNDLFYLPRKNGEYAIFPLNGNDRGYKQQNDIYKIKIPVPGKELTEIILKGIVSIEDNNWPMHPGTEILIIDNKSGDTLKKVDVNLESGVYNTELSSGSFKIVYSVPGYKSHVAFMLIPKIYAKTEYVLNVTLKPILVSKGDYYVIKNVFFDFGLHDLSKESLIEIEKLFDIMSENKDLYIEVAGYADSRSSKDFNKKLSERRAKSVIDYLISKGLSSQRFIAIAKGEDNPIAINVNQDGTDNPEGRKLNRRVEIKLMNYNGNKIIVENIKVPKWLVYKNQESSILIVSSDMKLSDMYLKSKLADLGLDQKTNKISSRSQDGKFNYYIEGYRSKADALKDLNVLVDNNFASARIVEKVESEIKDPVMKQLVKGDYTIQIKALKVKVEAKEFTELRDVQIYECKDGFYRYTYGIYKTREEAETIEKTIEADDILKDAFIVSIKALKKY